MITTVISKGGKGCGPYQVRSFITSFRVRPLTDLHGVYIYSYHCNLNPRVKFLLSFVSIFEHRNYMSIGLSVFFFISAD